MQGRSWMAALTLATSAVLALGRPAPAGDAPVVNKVRLELHITGLSASGCEVEIKPGNPACSFTTQKQKMTKRDCVLEPIEVQSTSADRDCSFSITIREPGQAAKTFQRGLRLSPVTPGQPTPVKSLACYLTTPSMLAKGEKQRDRR